MSESLEIDCDRLILRPVTTLDIPAYEKHFIDYEVIRHLSGSIPWPYPENGVADWMVNHILALQGQDRWFWGIFLKDNPSELIGGVELWRPGTPENRGFWLGSAHWGNGYMTEAVVQITDYAFDVLEFNKLIFSNAKGNTRSGRVKEKTGATLLRTEPFNFVDPAYTLREIWELDKDDWKQHRENKELQS